MKDNLNERNSAPTGANDQVNEMKLEANDPLGGAACSASCFSAWGDTFEEAVLAVIDAKEKRGEEGKAKYIRENRMTPEQMANEIKNGRFPYAGLSRF